MADFMNLGQARRELARAFVGQILHPDTLWVQWHGQGGVNKVRHLLQFVDAQLGARSVVAYVNLAGDLIDGAHEGGRPHGGVLERYASLMIDELTGEVKTLRRMAIIAIVEEMLSMGGPVLPDGTHNFGANNGLTYLGRHSLDKVCGAISPHMSDQGKDADFGVGTPEGHGSSGSYFRACVAAHRNVSDRVDIWWAASVSPQRNSPGGYPIVALTNAQFRVQAGDPVRHASKGFYVSLGNFRTALPVLWADTLLKLVRARDPFIKIDIL